MTLLKNNFQICVLFRKSLLFSLIISLFISIPAIPGLSMESASVYVVVKDQCYNPITDAYVSIENMTAWSIGYGYYVGRTWPGWHPVHVWDDQYWVYVQPGYNWVYAYVESESCPIRDLAIIVAGSGPYEGNNIWNEIQMCAKTAYNALHGHGYDKDAIYYLSANTILDLNGDDVVDVDNDATNKNFEYAIKSWGLKAKNLLIYMVGHGGKGTFRMSATELLDAETLDTWLDDIQVIIPGNVILVYDACRGGSIIPLMTPPSDKERIVVTGTSSDNEAIFSAGGTLSFSYLFWSQILNGYSFYYSFNNAADGVGLVYSQIPQLEANGDGIANQDADEDIVVELKIGDENKYGDDIPYIENIGTSPQTLEGDISATIYAENVVDADGISRVWAVIKPPDYTVNSPDIPANLPAIDLKPVGNGRYEAVYKGFITEGIYDITINAVDVFGYPGFHKQTSINQTSGTESLAVIYGSVINETGTPLCTLVLANGQYMFTCDENQGEYNLTVPLDEKGEITLFAFCDGLAPFKKIITPNHMTNFDIYMSDCTACPTMTLTYNTDIKDSKTAVIQGSVLNENGIPLCAMVLANGQHMFTCGDNEGKYELEVPLDENGEITMFGFCDGVQPYKEIINPKY